MISVKVTYTVQPGFVLRNQENIAIFLKDFRALKSTHFSYTVSLLEDGKTFVHISLYKDEQIQQTLLNIPSFLDFQQQRDESGLEVQPRIELMKLIGSTEEFL